MSIMRRLVADQMQRNPRQRVALHLASQVYGGETMKVMVVTDDESEYFTPGELIISNGVKHAVITLDGRIEKVVEDD